MFFAHHITLALTKKKQQKPDENDAMRYHHSHNEASQ